MILKVDKSSSSEKVSKKKSERKQKKGSKKKTRPPSSLGESDFDDKVSEKPPSEIIDMT